MKEPWKAQLSTQADHVLKTLDRELRYHGIQAKTLRKQADRFRISTLALASATTIVLGLQLPDSCWWVSMSNNVALVLGAGITVISGIATFWNIDKYRMQNIAMYLKLKNLRHRFVYEAKRAGGISDLALSRLHSDLQALKHEKVRYWEQAMEEED